MTDDPKMPFDLSADPAAFRRHIDNLKAGLRRRFGPGVPATSAVDQALLKSLEEMRDGKTPTGLWVRVRRRAIDLLRQALRHDRALEKIARQPTDGGVDPAEEAAARELREQLVQAAEGLPEVERQVWLLYCDGQAESAIVATLNKSPAAVKMALSRARQKVAAWRATRKVKE